jgi:DNA-binding Lrp family transcriptional regulator
MTLDKIDHKILWNLDYNARMPLSDLAKTVGLSKQGINYRLHRLIEDKVILGTMSVIDSHHLGYLTHRVYFRYKNVNEKKEKEIIDYFIKRNDTLWVVSLSGAWDLEVVFLAKNIIEFNNHFKSVREIHGAFFVKYQMSMSICNYHFHRDYLLNKKRELFNPLYYGFEPKEEKLDKLDIALLTELSHDCRRTASELGKKLFVSYHTVQERIKNLEEKKIIQAHRIFMDLSKIGRKFYKAQISLNAVDRATEKKLYSFCSQFNAVVYLVEVVGDWQFEIETEVEDQEEFNEIMRKVRNAFPDLILDYNILQATKEHKINYFPGLMNGQISKTS